MSGIRSRLLFERMLRGKELHTMGKASSSEGIVFVNTIVDILVVLLPGGIGLLYCIGVGVGGVDLVLLMFVG